MPIYEYECKRGHVSESLAASFEGAEDELQCPHCDGYAVRRISSPNVKLAWVPVMIDSTKEIWDGTPLEGTDGVNQVHYKSDKLFIDQGR
jgi:putative FmdB family regulatory protein